MNEQQIADIKNNINKLTDMIVKNNDNLTVAISKNHVTQTRNIGELKTSIAVLSTKFENRVNQCGNSFKLVDEKLDRDYVKINAIEKKDEIEGAVKKYKKESTTEGRDSTKYVVYILLAIMTLVISVDKISGMFKDKDKPTPVHIERSVN